MSCPWAWALAALKFASASCREAFGTSRHGSGLLPPNPTLPSVPNFVTHPHPPNPVGPPPSLGGAATRCRRGPACRRLLAVLSCGRARLPRRAQAFTMMHLQAFQELLPFGGPNPNQKQVRMLKLKLRRIWCLPTVIKVLLCRDELATHRLVRSLLPRLPEIPPKIPSEAWSCQRPLVLSRAKCT